MSNSGATTSTPWWQGFVSGLAGGIVAAAAALGATWMTEAGDKRATHTARVEAAYSTFLASANEIQATYLVGEKTASVTPPEFEGLYTTLAAVQLVGSDEAVPEAQVMFNRLRSATTATGDERDALETQYRAAESAFIDAVRSELDIPDSE